MAESFIRIKDIAKYCGVSVPTVSDILNGKAKQKRISDSTAKKVMAVADKLNYKVNLQARNMAKGRSYTIGAVFCRLDNTFYSRIFHGFYDICIENNCSPLVFISDWDHEKEKKAIDQLIGMRVDGIVISPACTIASAANLEILVKQQLPLCIFEQGHTENADFICFDNHSGIFDTVKMLASKKYNNICIALRRNSSLATQERLAGFHDGLEAAGIDFNQKMLFYIDEKGYHDLDYFQSGYENTLKILKLQPNLEALICLNDEFALGAYHAAQELKLKIPEDIAIVGYGNRGFASHMQPPLTTLHQDIDEIGRKIGMQLFKRIENRKSKIVKQLIKTPLVERGSC